MHLRKNSRDRKVNAKAQVEYKLPVFDMEDRDYIRRDDVGA